MTIKTTFQWSKVQVGNPSDCWPWLGPKNIWGYGYCMLNGKLSNASRAAFVVANGEISDGLVVCHACDNPACCNPAHLWAGTQAQNLEDCRKKGRARYRFGSEHHRVNAKLSEDKVLEAKRRYKAGEPQTKIAADFGVHSSVISRAVRGKCWGHVK